MTPTPLDRMAERVQDAGYRLDRPTADNALDVALWMTDDTLGEPGCGAWAEERDLYGVILPIAGRLWWLRLTTHEAWLARGGV